MSSRSSSIDQDEFKDQLLDKFEGQIKELRSKFENDPIAFAHEVNDPLDGVFLKMQIRDMEISIASSKLVSVVDDLSMEAAQQLIPVPKKSVSLFLKIVTLNMYTPDYDLTGWDAVCYSGPQCGFQTPTKFIHVDDVKPIYLRGR